MQHRRGSLLHCALASDADMSVARRTWTIDIIHPENFTKLQEDSIEKHQLLEEVSLGSTAFDVQQFNEGYSVSVLETDNNLGSYGTQHLTNHSNIDYEGTKEAIQESSIGGAVVVAGLSLYLLAFGTAIGNALVIHAIRTEKRLQTVSNLFIMSLAVADLIVGVIVMPISATYTVAGSWRWGIMVCQFWLAVDYTASTASIFNLVVLSLDRYWSVSSPLLYLRRRTRKRALLLIGASWSAALLWLIPILSWHHIFNQGKRSHPASVCETEFSTSITFKVITSLLNFYGPSALLVVLYCRIFQTIRMRSTDALGRVVHLEQSSYLPSPLPVANKKTFRNLTIISLPQMGIVKDSPTYYFSGINVFVEYTGDYVGSHLHPPNEERFILEDKYIKQPTLRISKGKEHRKRRKALQGRERLKTKMMNSHSKIESESTQFSSKFSHYSDHRHLNSSTENRQNHEHHLACYQSSHSPTYQEEANSSSSATEAEHRTWYRGSQRVLTGGIRGFLMRGRTLKASRSNSSSSSSERKSGDINLAKERKAARQLGVIMGAFLACWLPYFTMFPVIAFCSDCVPPTAHLVATWLGYLNSALPRRFPSSVNLFI